MSKRPDSQPMTMPVDRRTFLVASGVGFAGMTFGSPAPPELSAANSSRGGTAKSTILFFLCGGASHVDTWDMKPEAPLEYRGLFKPIATSAPGVQLCEHLPFLAQQAHHLAVVNSLGATVNTNDHHGGYYYNLTGHAPDLSFLTLGNDRTPFPDDWPFMGSVVAARRPPGMQLPNAVTLPHKPSTLPHVRPGQFAARLGVEHDPLYVYSGDEPLEFSAPSLVLSGDVSAERLSDRHELMQTISAARRNLDDSARLQTWTRQQERALSLLSSSRTSQAFDLSRESPKLRERYGCSINGTSLLLARRLVEAGVPFVTVFWYDKDDNGNYPAKCKSGGGWDTHGQNFNLLKNRLLPEFDRGFSALIEDLANRDLLEQTLLMVTSEMGRKPKIGDPRSGGPSGNGRDHWTHCMSDLLAGGGIQGGQTYGTSDRYGEYPADLPVTPADVTKTVYHAMGIENLEAVDNLGRPYNLLSEGNVIGPLL